MAYNNLNPLQSPPLVLSDQVIWFNPATNPPLVLSLADSEELLTECTVHILVLHGCRWISAPSRPHSHHSSFYSSHWSCIVSCTPAQKAAAPLASAGASPWLWPKCPQAEHRKVMSSTAAAAKAKSGHWQALDSNIESGNRGPWQAQEPAHFQLNTTSNVNSIYYLPIKSCIVSNPSSPTWGIKKDCGGLTLAECHLPTKLLYCSPSQLG